MKKLNVALVSHRYKGSKTATRQATIEAVKKVAKEGAQLVVLQELHQTHYFCQTQDVANFDLAGEFESECEFWANAAKEAGVVLVTSLFERRSEGLYHNTAVVFDKDGSKAGMQRKMHIPDDPQFCEKFYFTPGEEFGVIHTSVGRLGVLVCWDQWYPEAARIMALKGAQILIYPTAIGWFEADAEDEKRRQLDAWIAVQRGHAVANSLPVVAVNRVGFEAQKASSEPTSGEGGLNEAFKESGSKSGEAGILFWGHSFVFGAQGELLFCSDAREEVARVVSLDLQRCESVRRWWPFLRDRRIEAYGGLTKRFLD